MTEPAPSPTPWVIWPKPGPMTGRLRWRRWARLRAAVGGYFWLPCPLCGQMFGGQEYSGLAIYDDHDPPTNPLTGKVVCPAHDPVYPPPVRSRWADDVRAKAAELQAEKIT